MIDTVKEKTNPRSSLSSLKDNPFLDDRSGAAEPFAEEGEDSIFSLAPLPKERTSGPKPVSETSGSGSTRPGPAAAPPRGPAEARREEASAAGAESLEKDPVLKVLVQHGVLAEKHLAALSSRLPSQPPGLPPWRAALTLPDVPHEKILAVAAHLHEVPFVDLRQNPRYMLVTTIQSLPRSFRQECFELRLLPFACGLSEETGEIVLKLASDDPLNPKVTAFLEGLKMEALLYYAPATRLSEAVQSIADELEASPES